MNILKWYATILVIISLIYDLYKAGKEEENILIVFGAVLLEMPVIIYLILS